MLYMALPSKHENRAVNCFLFFIRRSNKYTCILCCINLIIKIYFCVSIDFTRCTQIHDGDWRKSWTSRFKSRGSSATWIHDHRGWHETRFFSHLLKVLDLVVERLIYGLAMISFIYDSDLFCLHPRIFCVRRDHVRKKHSVACDVTFSLGKGTMWNCRGWKETV